MASSRRGIPDNLDPLVDTLSNVVGILVMVVALAQIQVGDAVDRLLSQESREAAAPAATAPVLARSAPSASLLGARRAEVDRLRQALLDRGGAGFEESIEAAEAVVAQAAELPSTAAGDPGSSGPSGARGGTGVEASLATRLAEKRTALEEARIALEQREAHAESLQRVPRELVARLPDPEILTGREQWMLCRYGRCFVADQAKLVGAGEQAIGRILIHHLDARSVRDDEYEMLAKYLRKKDVGDGPFVWRFVTRPEPLARLVWKSRDGGVEASRLEGSPVLQRWLRSRDPEKDFIRFHVWSDSFETYLEARRVVEAAGFRAGWKAYEADSELELPVTFGAPRPKERPVEVD